MRRVRPERAHAANPARSGHDREVQQIFPLAAKYLVSVIENAGCDDVDNDLAGAQHGVGQGLDGEG